MMDIKHPLALLGGLSPQRFMARYWQKKPLLIRQAIPDLQPLLKRSELFALAGRDDVQSRLIIKNKRLSAGWTMESGPFKRTALPALKQAAWTLLVQSVDLHEPAAHALLRQFAFLPQARLDDLMISYATDQGGVGPHFDSYDVFLLQAHGKRRWHIGRQKNLALMPDVPLKILAQFEPEESFDLEPGDMLYLPPRYAHDGVAQGECMTYSIGFRAPSAGELAQEMLQRLADTVGQDMPARLYADPKQSAVAASGAIPEGLFAFAHQSLGLALSDPQWVQRVLGEYLTEPKASVYFDDQGGSGVAIDQGVQLHPKTRMLYAAPFIFINGESFEARGKDAGFLKILADTRVLNGPALHRLSPAARTILMQWFQTGWLEILVPTVAN